MAFYEHVDLVADPRADFHHLTPVISDATRRHGIFGVHTRNIDVLRELRNDGFVATPHGAVGFGICTGHKPRKLFSGEP